MAKPGQYSVPAAGLASGLLSALAFPPFGLGGLVLVAPVPLLWALEARRGPGIGLRRAFLIGWAAAFLHFLIVLHWILALPDEEVTIPGLMMPGLLFMAGYLALYFGAAACAATAVARRFRLPLGIVWAVMATAADAARSAGQLGFPWGSTAYALVDAKPVLQMTSITGFWGLVLWVNLIGGLLYHALSGAGRLRRAAALAAAVLLVVPWVGGSIVLARAPRNRVDGPSGIRLAVLQPNTSRTIKWDPRFRDIVIDDLLARTRRAAETKPDLIIWPETAVPMVLLEEPVYLERVERTVRDIGIPLLAGTLDHGVVAGSYVAHNSAALFDKTGRVVARYDKQRLVPFSERMPYEEIVPWIAALNFGQSDFTPGTRDVLFHVGEARIGCMICFEAIFPEMARRFVAEGANVLLNITNDFWFGRTAAPAQHAEMAVFRAVETRTPLVRCANTGISMIVDPWGRVSHATPIFVEAEIDTRVSTIGGTSFYVRHGDWIRTIVLALAAAMLVSALAVARWGRAR